LVPLLIGLAVGVVGLVVCAATLWRQRALVRRLDALSGRLDPERVVVFRGAERAVQRVERAAQRTAASLDDSMATIGVLRAALDRIPEGVVVFDAEGVAVATNEAATAMAGTHHGDAIVLDVVRSLAAGARQAVPAHRMVELVGPPRRSVVVRAMPIDTGGGAGALVVLEDVTQRQRLEEVRTDFVANVSHELKTPVGALALLAETLVGESDPDVVSRLADRMVGEAHRLGSIITDLLELSRVESGDDPIRASIALKRLFNESIERVRTLAEQRGILIERAEPAKATVRGDRRQLVSAVGNMLENAITYSDAGSTVALSATVTDTTLQISVRDNGQGIPSRDLDRVFERFYRVDRARGRERGGTGLGLAIVRHVAENHGGRVDVESIEGSGSVFTLTVPSTGSMTGPTADGTDERG
jgi:two-component system, OmpR family, sensor histidine kinase SenX3